MEVYSHIRIPFLFALLLASLAVAGSTRVGFYKTTCPQAEAIVGSVVQSAIRSNKTYAPAILQMFFHDCFVNGCDASILLDGSLSEKTALPNVRLRGFEVIDSAKSMLETVCPRVVSCADILALAARDSVVQSGGSGWAVPTGRRDGLVSQASDVDTFPGSGSSIENQIEKFAIKGLNITDLVTLVGAHTIGTAACNKFSHRLYDFEHTNGPDPALDQAFLLHLRSLCPVGGDEERRVALDIDSVNTFDNSFYENVRSRRGVLKSDSNLWSDPRTQKLVQQIIGARKSHPPTFNKMFARAMLKMSKIELKTGNQGEIRRVCNSIN